jgi:phosphatidylglycerophosphate synthase
MKNFGKTIYKNIPNIVTILGVLPLALLFSEQGYQYLIPLIVYNNIMDDLDGTLAAKLNLKSDFGAKLDNVCDAVSHTLFVMVIGMHYGLACGLISVVAIAAILIRVVSRLDPSNEKGTGSPTNELIRHVFFALLLADMFSFHPAWPLIAMFLLNTVSMHIPYPMPYMIRSLAKSATTVGVVNILLISDCSS